MHWAALPQVKADVRPNHPTPIGFFSSLTTADGVEVGQAVLPVDSQKDDRRNRRSHLEALERVVLRSPRLQQFVLRTHRRAFQALLPQLGKIRRVTIVGGGLFPRTALLLSELLPAARLTIVDSDARNLQAARELLDRNVEFRHERFLPGESLDCDLAVIPLCLRGDRAAVYRHPASPAVLVHDWIWRRRGPGAVVSFVLFKRLNLVRR
jgi:hypothetical protein